MELEDERKGLEITMKGVEHSSAAAQAILYEGGNADFMKQVLALALAPAIPALAPTPTSNPPLTYPYPYNYPYP